LADLVDNLAPQVQIQLLDFFCCCTASPSVSEGSSTATAGLTLCAEAAGPAPESFRLSLLEVSAHPNKSIEGGYQWPLSAFEVLDEAQPNS
jgi:hypothetical protein